MLEVALESMLYGRDPDAPAIVVEREPAITISYGRLRDMVEGLRVRLRALGLRPGYVLPMAVDRTPEAIALILATALEGGVFAPFESAYGADHLRRLVEETQAVALVLDAFGLQLLKSELAELSDVPCVYLETERASNAPEPPGVGVPDSFIRLSLKDAAAVAASPRPGRSVADAASAIIFTSGSTGRSKSILAPGTCFAANALSDRLIYRMSGDDKILHMLSFGSAFALDQLFSTILAGAALHLFAAPLNKTEWRKQICAIVKRSRITGFHWGPDLLHYFTEGIGAELLFDDETSLRFMSMGGAASPPALLERLARLISPKVAIYKSYGLGEVSRISVLEVSSRDGALRTASVGRPVAGCRVFIARDHTELAEPEEPGEVAVIDPMRTMRGYLGDEALTRERLGSHAAFPGATVVYTGDQGRLDREGYLFLSGRVDRMVKRSFVKIYPDAIESDFMRHPAVLEALAFGIEVMGPMPTRIVAILRARVTAEELTAWARANMPPTQIPDDVRVWDEFPRTPMGKIAIPEVRRRYLSEQCPWKVTSGA